MQNSFMDAIQASRRRNDMYQFFRLEVNLSEFFDDVRQSCYIFVDGWKMQKICHIEEYISSLFNIKKPFHLMLKHSYLPPSVDARVLANDDTIRVIPGSGINDESVSNVSAMMSNICENQSEMRKVYNNAAHSKEAQTTDANHIAEAQIVAHNASYISNNISNNKKPISRNTTVDLTFHSMNEDTEAETDSKIIDCSNLTEDCNTTELSTPFVKRRRIRKRKPKNKSSLVTSLSDTNEEKEAKKPKIIDSFVISSGKHIRFNVTKAEENNVLRETEAEDSDVSKQLANKSPVGYLTNNVKSNVNKLSSSKDLSTLLALRGSSTPITFAKKVKDEVKKENLLTEKTKSINDLINITKENNTMINENDISIENNLCSRQISNEAQCKTLLRINPKEIPVMTRELHIGDTIAFKTLKIATDYTPQVSNFIVGKVLNFCAQSATYILKIIEGKEEIEMPPGKFSVSDDESTCSYNEITLSYQEIREPRLVA